MYHNIVDVGPFQIEWEQWEVCVGGVWKAEQEGKNNYNYNLKKIKT